MPTVELHQAYLWTCDDCGRDNFERAVVLDVAALDDAERESAARLAEATCGEADAIFLTSPDAVTCPHCGTTFATEEP